MARSRRSRKRAQPRPWHEPSDKEKCQKIDQAITALESGIEFFQIIADKHNQLAFDLLGVSEAEEIADWALTFLHEIKAAGPIQCFVGRKAKRCYEAGYSNLFLFPYKIQSEYFDEIIYLKFAIQTLEPPSGKTYYYCHCTLHEDEPEKGT
jgi:hypothetical protein